MFIRSVLRNAAAEGDAGATSTSAQVAEIPPDDPAPRPPRANMHDVRQRTAADLRAHIASQRAAGAADETAPAPKPAKPAQAAKNDAAIAAAPTEEAEQLAEKIDDQGGKVPEKKAGESTEKYELRLAKALQDLKDQEVHHRREKARADAAEKRAGEFEAASKKLEGRLARGKSLESALEFLHDETGFSLEDLVKGINEGKVRMPRLRAALPPEVAEEIERAKKMAEENAAEVERLRKAEEAREMARQQAEGQRLMQQHITQVQGYLTDNADDFPVLAVTPSLAANIVQEVARRKTGGVFDGIAREFEDGYAEQILPVIGDARAFKALVARGGPELKAKIAEALELTEEAAPAVAEVAPAAPAAKPKAKPVSKVSSESSTPQKTEVDKLNRHDRLSYATAALRNHLRSQRG